MRFWFYLTFIIVLFSCANEFEGKEVKTIDNYKGKYKDLMVAAANEDLSLLDRIVRDNTLNLDYADSVNGVSILNWCILNRRQKAFEKLLFLGANPNWQDAACKFAPPVTEAAQVGNTTIYLELSLKYNGNPNILSKGILGIANQTPLFGAIYSMNINNLKILVKNGADVNLTHDEYWSPLAEALIQYKIEMARYLLENGADYTSMKVTTTDGIKLDILDLLRKLQFRLDSKEYKIKMEVVRFLKGKGLDYWKCSIPESIKEQHKQDSEYLSKY